MTCPPDIPSDIPPGPVPPAGPPHPLPDAASGITHALTSSRIFAALLSDLRRTARRLTRSGADADDLVQDTLLRVWARMAMAEQGNGEAKPVEDLRAYAFATLRHRAFRRGAQTAVVRPAPAAVEAAARRGAPADDIVAPRGSDGITRLACAEALAALDALPAEQRDLLRLRAIDGLSYAEIARRTGLPPGTVTSRLARGRAALRQALDLPPGTPISALLGRD